MNDEAEKMTEPIDAPLLQFRSCVMRDGRKIAGPFGSQTRTFANNNNFLCAQNSKKSNRFPL
jgi:hypothetical protein